MAQGNQLFSPLSRHPFRCYPCMTCVCLRITKYTTLLGTDYVRYAVCWVTLLWTRAQKWQQVPAPLPLVRSCGTQRLRRPAPTLTPRVFFFRSADRNSLDERLQRRQFVEVSCSLQHLAAESKWPTCVLPRQPSNHRHNKNKKGHIIDTWERNSQASGAAVIRPPSPGRRATTSCWGSIVRHLTMSELPPFCGVAHRVRSRETSS